jgi:hypothetical protein
MTEKNRYVISKDNQLYVATECSGIPGMCLMMGMKLVKWPGDNRSYISVKDAIDFYEKESKEPNNEETKTIIGLNLRELKRALLRYESVPIKPIDADRKRSAPVRA